MNRETVFETLFALLQTKPLQFTFTANLAEGSASLANVSDQSGLIPGMPVFGPGIPPDTTIASIFPTLTLSQPATATQAGAQILQGVRTYGRRLLHWSQCTKQPALLLISGFEHFSTLSSSTQRQSSMPAQVTLTADIWIYAKVNDPEMPPDIILNRVLDSLGAALEPPFDASTGYWQSLGLTGVMSARIEGDVQRWGGHQNGQAVALVPIVIRLQQGARTRLA
jgi:hypothetical protein